MKYRAEIDGLRALAVIPVVFFHAGISFFSGGFIGVDIFFVISGYLITSIIIDELSDGRFSIARFYERRARRILPALFVMLAFCIVFASLWIFPRELMRFARSILSVLFFYSNFYFMDHSGYFAPAADLQPLLHTWSLAVEEQFYLIFPVLIGFLWRFGRNTAFLAVIILSLASLAFCQWLSVGDPNAAFFLAPSRGWELLSGSICAFILSRRKLRPNGVLASLGLCMTISSLLFFNEAMPLPSLFTLMPVIGVCLIILFGSTGTLTARLLSVRPLVAIGLISYSVYLWHQPLMAFARIRSLDTPSTATLIGLGFLSFAIGYLSWRFVERPFRRKPTPVLKTQAKVFKVSGAMTGVIAAFCGFFIATHGLSARLPGKVEHILAAKNDTNPHREACLYEHSVFAQRPIGALPDPDCIFPNGSDSIDVAILGDSHGDAIAAPLIEALNAKNLTVTQITATACPPLSGYEIRDFDCTATTDKINNYILNSDTPVVIFAMRYAMVTEGTGFEKLAANSEDEALCKEKTPECRKQNGFRAIKREIESLIDAGKKVVIVYPIPEARTFVPQTFAKANLTQTLDELSYPEALYRSQYQDTIAFLDTLDAPGLYSAKPAEILCHKLHEGRCVQAEGDQVYYIDDNHLSVTGAKLIAPELSARAEQAVNDVRAIAPHPN